MRRSPEQRLRDRKDINNDDIPDIIARADELQSKALETEAKNKNKSSTQNIKNLGKKLNIEERFIEEAIRERQPQPEKKEPKPKQSNPKAAQSKESEPELTFKFKAKDLIFIGIVAEVSFWAHAVISNLHY